MKTYFAPGLELDFVASATIKSGDLVTAGSIVGVAASDYVNNETGVMEISGIHRLLKVASQVWTQGQPVYRVPATNTVSNIATANVFMGYAAAPALAPELTALVLLARPGS